MEGQGDSDGKMQCDGRSGFGVTCTDWFSHFHFMPALL